MTLGKFAAGRIAEKKLLNLATNGESSSLLEFGTHKERYPHINYTSKIEVETKILDNWLDENFTNKKIYNFINIDIQGYELEALKGMPKQLKIADYIYLEVNFEQVYDGCSELKEIDRYLKQFSFKRVGMRKTNKGWGDAIYTKNNIFFYRIYYIFLQVKIAILRILKKSTTFLYKEMN